MATKAISNTMKAMLEEMKLMKYGSLLSNAVLRFWFKSHTSDLPLTRKKYSSPGGIEPSYHISNWEGERLTITQEIMKKGKNETRLHSVSIGTRWRMCSVSVDAITTPLFEKSRKNSVPRDGPLYKWVQKYVDTISRGLTISRMLKLIWGQLQN